MGFNSGFKGLIHQNDVLHCILYFLGCVTVTLCHFVDMKYIWILLTLTAPLNLQFFESVTKLTPHIRVLPETLQLSWEITWLPLKVPVILHDDIQRESRKPYGIPNGHVTAAATLATNTGTSAAPTAETHWYTRTRLRAPSLFVTLT